MFLKASALGIITKPWVYEYVDHQARTLSYTDRPNLSKKKIGHRAIIATELLKAPWLQWEFVASQRHEEQKLTGTILYQQGHTKPDHILELQESAYTLRWHCLGGFPDATVVMSYYFPGDGLRGLGRFDSENGAKIFKNLWPDFISRDWQTYLSSIYTGSIEAIMRQLVRDDVNAIENFLSIKDTLDL